MDSALSFRERIQNERASFDVNITADYGEKIYSFSMHCQSEPSGSLRFSVKEPQSIGGISGYIDSDNAQLIFTDTELAFPILADGQFTPVSAPWVLIRSLQGGYINGAGFEDELVRISVDDSYDQDALHLDVWLDAWNKPIRGEILWDNKRILTMDVSNFLFE